MDSRDEGGRVGLDLYAGPLTRYYAGLWKTVTQQMGEATGMQVRVVYAGGEPERPSAEDARGVVVAWQRALRDATGIADMTWAESELADYFTDKPDWDGYWALLFLAAADEFPEVAPPAEVPHGDPTRQPLWRRVEAAYQPKQASRLRRLFGGGGHSVIPSALRYPHLLGQQELWLPADFEHPFTAPDPTGIPTSTGSVPWLLRELEELNQRTLGGDAAALEEWRARGPSEDDFTLRRVAEFGLAVFVEAARFSVEHRVPLKLDY